MIYILKFYKTLAMLFCLVILIFEPIVRGILKERLDIAEIKEYYKVNLKDWTIYFKGVWND